MTINVHFSTCFKCRANKCLTQWYHCWIPSRADGTFSLKGVNSLQSGDSIREHFAQSPVSRPDPIWIHVADNCRQMNRVTKLLWNPSSPNWKEFGGLGCQQRRSVWVVEVNVEWPPRWTVTRRVVREVRIEFIPINLNIACGSEEVASEMK